MRNRPSRTGKTLFAIIGTTLLFAAHVAASTSPSTGAGVLSSGSNLLSDPSFDTWSGWTRAGNQPASSIWHSSWIGWTDGHTGSGYNIVVKHPSYDPKDNTTPVDVWMYQNITNISPGNYEASLWFKVNGIGSKWDGPGGADQWTDFRIYYWADNACTQMVYAHTAPRIEIVTPQWTKVSLQFTVPQTGVAAISFYAYARLVDQWDKAYVCWDDAYVGLVGESMARISDLKALPDGSQVSLAAKTVTRNFGDHFYVEESDRSCGIKVAGAAAAGSGQAVPVQGTLSTSNGEREISAASVGLPVTSQAIKPLGVGPKSIDGSGLSTVGLLVRTWGRVTSRDANSVPDWFMISEGSSAKVRVQNYAGVSVEPGDYVWLTAVHGRYADASGNAPLLKLASLQDFYNTSPTPAQMVSRGDFECTWSQFTSAFTIEGSTSNVSLDSTTRWRGSKSLKIVNSSTNTNTFANQDIPIDCLNASRRLRISFMCKAQNVVRGIWPWYGVRGIVWLYDSAGQLLSQNQNVYDLTEFPTGSFDWHYYERTLILPKGVAKIKLQLGLNGAAGTAWFDDVGAVEVFDDYLVAEDTTAYVAVDQSNVTSNSAEGLGWNWETVSPERYSAPELAVWPQLYARMSWDGPDWLRIGILPSMCPPSEYVRGGDTGQHYTYNFNTTQIIKLCELLDYCQTHNIHVLLANWNAGQAEYWGVPNGQWLVKGYYDGTGSAAPDWWVPYSKDRMAECLADLTYYLRVTKGFTCIKYVNLWNEPNGPWTQIGQYPQGFLDIFNLFDAKLRAKGIRNLIKIEGLDAVEAGDSTQITVDAVRSYGAVLDAVSVHDYSYGLEAATQTTSSWLQHEFIEDYVPIIQQLNTMRSQPIPFLIAETNGFGTYPIYTQRERYLTSLAAAEYCVEMLKIGADGILRWQYNDPGTSQFEPFTLAGLIAVPNRELYYPWCVLTRWTVKGSDILNTRVTGGLDARSRVHVHAVALRAPGGQITILLTNNGRQPKTVSIDIGSPAGAGWHHYYYPGSLPDGVQQGDVPTVSGNVLAVTVPPESVNALTTFAVTMTGDAPQ